MKKWDKASPKASTQIAKSFCCSSPYVFLLYKLNVVVNIHQLWESICRFFMVRTQKLDFLSKIMIQHLEKAKIRCEMFEVYKRCINAKFGN
jgi:hypothetical protein